MNCLYASVEFCATERRFGELGAETRTIGHGSNKVSNFRGPARAPLQVGACYLSAEFQFPHVFKARGRNGVPPAAQRRLAGPGRNGKQTRIEMRKLIKLIRFNVFNFHASCVRPYECGA